MMLLYFESERGLLGEQMHVADGTECHAGWAQVGLALLKVRREPTTHPMDISNPTHRECSTKKQYRED